MSSSLRVGILAGLLTSVLALAAEPSRPALAVMDFESRGAQALEAEAATRSAIRGLRQLDVFQILGADEIRELLALERSRELLGVKTDATGSGMRLMREALGARHVVTGVVARVGNDWQVDLRLLDTSDATVVAQKSLGPVKGIEAIARNLPGLAQELVGPLLQAQQGGLLVRANEEAVEVVVDDVLRGSTPMPAALQLPRGTHRLELRKDGFITQAKAIRVEPDQVSVEEVSLVPSPDYAEAYQLRHGRLRVGAWIATGVALASLGGALYLDRQTEAEYQNRFIPWRAAVNEDTSRAELRAEQQPAYDACVGQGKTSCADNLGGLQSRLATQQYVTWGLAGVGALATGAAAYLWITGEDPNRYADLVAGVNLGPIPGFVLTGRF